jgi:hypothetical protein
MAKARLAALSTRPETVLADFQRFCELEEGATKLDPGRNH